MKNRWKSTFMGTLAMLLACSPLFAGDIVGYDEYMKNCAVCHGTGGRGDGPFAQFLREKPRSLTRIAERNNGMFPVKRIYGIIAGTEGVQEHGSLQMPIWGERYLVETVNNPDIDNYGPYGSPSHYEDAVRGRILELIMYLVEIQEFGGSE